MATVEIDRPPHNFFDVELIDAIADAYEALDRMGECRAIVLCANGRNFCAGANFGGGEGASARDNSRGDTSGHLYRHAVRIFRARKPVVAAVQGAAVGGGLGLAVSADFRVASPESRFSANFTRLGFHPGFGLTLTLPEVIGRQKASLMFYTGRRVKGDEAHAWGLVDVLAESSEGVRPAAHALAEEIATSARRASGRRCATGCTTTCGPWSTTCSRFRESRCASTPRPPTGWRSPPITSSWSRTGCATRTTGRKG